MNKELNNLIKRKNFQNYIKGGLTKMNYGISEEVRQNAIACIENESINERLKVLKNQINFLTDTKESVLKNTTFSEDDAKVLKEDLSKINDCIDVLNFKKETLQVGLNDSLSNINIAQAVKVKTQLNEIDKQMQEFNSRKMELNNKINSSRNDYDVQLMKIREKYDNSDIVVHSIVDDEFSISVINDYKKERALKLTNQFLDSLTPEKKQQLLQENKELNDLINVGENI